MIWDLLFWVFVSLLFGTFVVPWIVFLSIKLGTLGYFCGKDSFLRYREKENKNESTN